MARSSWPPASWRPSTRSSTASRSGSSPSRDSRGRCPSSASRGSAANVLAQARAGDVRGGREHVGAAPPSGRAVPAGQDVARPSLASRGREQHPVRAVLLPIDTVGEDQEGGLASLELGGGGSSEPRPASRDARRSEAAPTRPMPEARSSRRGVEQRAFGFEAPLAGTRFRSGTCLDGAAGCHGRGDGFGSLPPPLRGG